MSQAYPNYHFRIIGDSRKYLNSIQSQVDRGVDEVIKYLDDEFQNWDTKVNETVQKEMNDAQIDKILDLSKFVLNVMKNFFKSNGNKTQILDHFLRNSAR